MNINALILILHTHISRFISYIHTKFHWDPVHTLDCTVGVNRSRTYAPPFTLQIHFDVGTSTKDANYSDITVYFHV